MQRVPLGSTYPAVSTYGAPPAATQAPYTQAPSLVLSIPPPPPFTTTVPPASTSSIQVPSLIRPMQFSFRAGPMTGAESRMEAPPLQTRELEKEMQHLDQIQSIAATPEGMEIQIQEIVEEHRALKKDLEDIKAQINENFEELEELRHVAMRAKEVMERQHRGPPGYHHGPPPPGYPHPGPPGYPQGGPPPPQQAPPPRQAPPPQAKEPPSAPKPQTKGALGNLGHAEDPYATISSHVSYAASMVSNTYSKWRS